MPQQSTARQLAQAAQKPQASAERDTLEAIDQDFLRDQLEALLASPTLARVADRHSEGRDDPADFDAEREVERGFDLESERDTEPGVDALLLREALRARLK